jgi:hypothetical protein
MASLAERCCTPHVYAAACFAALTTGRQYSGHGALGWGCSAPGMSSATDCKSGPCVAGQDGTEMGNQAAEQLAGGDRCLTRQLVSAGLSHQRLLGPGGCLFRIAAMDTRLELTTRRSQAPILSSPTPGPPTRRSIGFASGGCGRLPGRRWPAHRPNAHGPP